MIVLWCALGLPVRGAVQMTLLLLLLHFFLSRDAFNFYRAMHGVARYRHYRVSDAFLWAFIVHNLLNFSVLGSPHRWAKFGAEKSTFAHAKIAIFCYRMYSWTLSTRPVGLTARAQ